MDEPTVGLDPKQVIEIRNLIKSLGEKHTVIVSSHILSEISQICERVIIINKGEIVAVDTPANLEEKTKEQNVLYVTVEDPNENMLAIKEKMQDIKELEMVKNNEDGTKQYKIVSDSSKDIRKSLFEILPKEQITIFELKKAENSLEDAFIKLVDSNKNQGNNQEEQKEEQTEIEENKEEKQTEIEQAKTEETQQSEEMQNTEIKAEEEQVNDETNLTEQPNEEQNKTEQINEEQAINNEITEQSDTEQQNKEQEQNNNKEEGGNE